QQLLVDLWRLRQCEELARVHTAGDKEVSSTLGSRLGEDRRLDLQEAEVGEGAARALCEAMAQLERRLKLGPAQVQDPMLESQLLRGELLAVAARDRDGRCA